MISTSSNFPLITIFGTYFIILYITGLGNMLAIGVWTFWARPQAEAAQVFALSDGFYGT